MARDTRVRACRTAKGCATVLRRAAAKVRAQADTDSARRHGIVRMYRQDAENLFKLADHVAAGDKKRARELAWSLDTANRDDIPLSVYCWFAPDQVVRGCR